MKVFPLQALICWESFSKPALVLRELRLWYGCYGTQRQRNENKSIHQWSGRYLYHTQVKCILWPMAKGLRYLNWWIPQETSSNMPSFKDKQILNYNRMDTDNPKQTWEWRCPDLSPLSACRAPSFRAWWHSSHWACGCLYAPFTTQSSTTLRRFW